MTTVAVVGTGPAAEAARAALDDVDATVTTPAVEDLGGADLAVVVGVSGAAGFGEANEHAVENGMPWVAVEVGGVGGRAFEAVSASVASFAPGECCFVCLRERVAAASGPRGGGSPSAARSEVRFAGAIAGRQAVAALRGDDVGGELVEVPHARRRFLPVPGCPVCGDERDRTPRGGFEEVAIDEAAMRAERAVDDRVGLVTAVGEQESFPAPYYLAEGCDTTGFSDAEAARQAAGVAVDWNEAYVKAVGEALERYAAGVYRGVEFEREPTATREDAVPPSAFVLSDDYREPDPDEPVEWVPGRHLTTGEPVSLPAEFVGFPPAERRHRPAITTGLGLGTSQVGAMLSGTTEAIERDATMLAWYSTYDPLGLTVESESFDALARRAGSEGLTVTPFLVTQDVDVPVVSVAVHREGEEAAWPRFALGSAADLDAEAAATSALCEALQNWMELRAMGPDLAAEQEAAIGRYADFPGEVHDLVDPGTAVPAAGVGPADPPTGPQALDALGERLAAAGLDAYVTRLTTRDLETLGFEVVRVLVPEAQPLFTGEPYFGDRAQEVPGELGFEPRLDRAYHPYP